MSVEQYRALLELAHAHSADYLSALPDRFVGARAGREDLLRALQVPLSREGEPGAFVLDAMASQVEQGASACNSPRYFGFVIGGAYPVALAADWMVSTWDQNAGIFVISPLVAVMEEVAATWLLDLFGLPEGSGVGFVTGCQMANFTCLAAARNGVLRRVGWDVEADGLPGAPRINVVASAESHVTIDVALRYVGLGTRSVQRVESDAQGRMRADHLRQVLRTLEGPTIVCAQAGNVNTGAFDPLREIGEAVREHGAWLHVDGAFGLWARASAALAPLADGIELADSWATDAHKWLNVPYDSGIAIVADAAPHRAAMGLKASYLQRGADEERVGMDWVPDSSRRARILPLYTLFRTLGRDGIADIIRRNCALARRMAAALSQAPGVTILNDVVLNQVLVQFTNDDITQQVIAKVQADGTCWAGGAFWQGKQAMRISVSNWSTTEADIDQSAAAILACYQ